MHHLWGTAARLTLYKGLTPEDRERNGEQWLNGKCKIASDACSVVWWEMGEGDGEGGGWVMMRWGGEMALQYHNIEEERKIGIMNKL